MKILSSIFVLILLNFVFYVQLGPSQNLRELASTSGNQNCIEAISYFDKPNNELKKLIVNHGASEEFESELLYSIHNVNKLLINIGVPKDYKINLYKKIEHTSNYNGPVNEFGVIRGSENYLSIKKGSKLHSIHPKYSKAIILHEYGHEVFAQRVSAYLTNSKVLDFFRGREQIFINLALSDKLKREVIALTESGVTDSELVDHPTFKAFRKATLEMNSGFDIYNTELKDQIIPYDELFADLIAVMSIDDPRAMYRATSAGGRKGNSRDFTAKYGLHNWNDKRPHTLFDPVRSHIYRNYLSSPHYKNRKHEIIEIVLSAIAKEIDYNASNGFSDSVESMNMNLIDQIDKTAQEL